MLTISSGLPLHEGKRIGRFLLLRDLDGHLHAIAAGSITAITETDAGSVLLLPGGRLVQVGQSLENVLGWLDGRVIGR